MRVLVTGSRGWVDEWTLQQTLWLASRFTMGPAITLVSGACPRGADAMAESFAEEAGWAIERHPANWDLYGKRAGFIRNQEMVDAGADICVAFVFDESKGAMHTYGLAMTARMPAIRVSDWSAPVVPA